MLATRSTSRIVAHERPDLIEVGSAWFAPWLVHLATRRVDLPAVWFYHSNFPRVIAPWPERAGPVPARAGRVRLALRPAAGPHGPCDARAVRLRRPASSSGRAWSGSCASGWAWTSIDSIPRRRRRGGDAPARTACPTARSPSTWAAWRAEKEVDLLLAAWPEVRAPHRRPPRAGGRWPRAPPAAAACRAASGTAGCPFQRDRDRLADLLAAVDLAVAPCSHRDLRPLGAGGARQRHAAPVRRSRRGGRDGGPLGRRRDVRLGRRRRPGRGCRPAPAGRPRRRSAPPAAATPRRTTAGTRCSTASSTSIAESWRREPARLDPRRHPGARETGVAAPVGALRRRGACGRRCSSSPTGTASGRWSRIPASSPGSAPRAAEGAEIVLHGERHDEVGLPRAAGATPCAPGAAPRAKASS